MGKKIKKIHFLNSDTLYELDNVDYGQHIANDRALIKIEDKLNEIIDFLNTLRDDAVEPEELTYEEKMKLIEYLNKLNNMSKAGE